MLTWLLACDPSSEPGPRVVDSPTTPHSTPPPAPTPPAPQPTTPTTPPAPCGSVGFTWDPDAGDVDVVAFPDDRWTDDDPSVASGVRVRIGDTGWFAGLTPLTREMLGHAEGAPGFARLGHVVLAFDGDLGSVPDASSLRLVDLDTGAEHPIAARLADDGQLLVVEPLTPLAAAATYAVVLERAHLAADGACVQPSAALTDALAGRRDDRLGERLARVPAAAGVAAEQLSAAVVFTTADGGADLAAAVADVQSRAWGWAEPLACASDGVALRCEGVLDGADYRVVRGAAGPGAVGPVETARWEVPVSVRAPLSAASPLPVVVYGHGMDSSRGELDYLWQHVDDLGVVVVAQDALYHGDHPTRRGLVASIPFLGIDVLDASVDAPQARGSFDQSALDRLQLLEALAASPSLPGGPALDLGRVGYHGSSLGGLLGPGVVAHADVDAAFLTCAGGDLVRLATDIELGPASTVGDVLRVAMGRDDLAWELFLAVEQVALDGSDPAVHAARPQVASTHLFLPVGQDDELVTRASGQALARALALPQVEPVVEGVATLSPATPPLVGNVAGRTRGYFQHEVVTRGGQVVASTHNATLNSPEVATQLRAWWAAWVAGTPQIVAP